MIDVCKREKQNKSPAKLEELSHAGHAHLIPIQYIPQDPWVIDSRTTNFTSLNGPWIAKEAHSVSEKENTMSEIIEHLSAGFFSFFAFLLIGKAF